MNRARRRSPSSWEHAALLALALLFRASPAGAAETPQAEPTDDSKRKCIAQHEQAQVAMRAGSLMDTRAKLLACSQDGCPSIVRVDCASLLETVNLAMPTIIVSAKSGDIDEDQVVVTIDGQVVTSRLDGRPVELNPGLHTFRFQASARETVERQVLLVQGEKNRVLAITFEPSRPGLTTDVVPLATDPYRPVPVLDYVLGAVAVAGLGAFATFGIAGMDERKSLQSSCSPSCSSSQLGSVRAKLLAADIGLGAAVLSIAGGAYLYVTRPPAQRTSTRPNRDPFALRAPRVETTVALTPTPSGVLLSLQGWL